jgi:xanthine dehydrogenase accessory factor
MDSVDLEVLDTSIDWLRAGHQITLVTVAQTWGSAPRSPGSWLALREDGVLVGSVSGGCIEEDLVRRLREGLLPKAQPELVAYGVTKEDATRFGLPCGGKLQLVVEPNPGLPSLEELARRIRLGERIVRNLQLATGAVHLAAAEPGQSHTFDGVILTTLHGPRYRLLIIGAVQIARYLSEMAQALDYQVTVCEPRDEYANAWHVTNAPLSRIMPDDAVAAMNPDPHSAIVALTHDPKLDDMALLEALKSPAFYVGALGSRRNNEKRRSRLAQFDLASEEISRLRGPVGLPIGSHTPPEIAVAILAELTAVRHGRELVLAGDPQMPLTSQIPISAP